MIDILPTIALWLSYGVAAMFLTLAGIMAIACVIYPLSILFEGIKRKLL